MAADGLKRGDGGELTQIEKRTKREEIRGKNMMCTTKTHEQTQELLLLLIKEKCAVGTLDIL